MLTYQLLFQQLFKVGTVLKWYLLASPSRSHDHDSGAWQQAYIGCGILQLHNHSLQPSLSASPGKDNGEASRKVMSSSSKSSLHLHASHPTSSIPGLPELVPHCGIFLPKSVWPTLHLFDGTPSTSHLTTQAPWVTTKTRSACYPSPNYSHNSKTTICIVF